MKRIVSVFLFLLVPLSAFASPAVVDHVTVIGMQGGISIQGFPSSEKQKIENLIERYDPHKVTIRCIGLTDKTDYRDGEQAGKRRDKSLGYRRASECVGIVTHQGYYAVYGGIKVLQPTPIRGARVEVLDEAPPSPSSTEPPVVELRPIELNLRIVSFAAYSDEGRFGAGGVVQFPWYYSLEYAFAGKNRHYDNRFLLGYRVWQSCAVLGGIAIGANDTDREDWIGGVVGGRCMPRIAGHVVAYLEGGVELNDLNQAEIDGVPQASVSGNTLTITTPVARAAKSSFRADPYISVGIGVLF